MPEARCLAKEEPPKCLASTLTLSHPDFARSASRATIVRNWYGMLRSRIQQSGPAAAGKEKSSNANSLTAPLEEFFLGTHLRQRLFNAFDRIRGNRFGATIRGFCSMFGSVLWCAFRNERKTCPSFAESVQHGFRKSPGTNPQSPGPPRNAPVRLVTFNSPKGVPGPYAAVMRLLSTKMP